jgi:hypothetical protein
MLQLVSKIDIMEEIIHKTSKKRLGLLLLIFILAVGVATLDRTGHFLSLYWSLWWFDILMHFLGGLLIGLASAWAYVFVFKKGTRGLIRATLLSVLIVGIFWELYEVYIGIQVTHEPYVWDTSVDIILDLIGAYLAGSFIKNSITTVDE